jgi:hypothetical protein
VPARGSGDVSTELEEPPMSSHTLSPIPSPDDLVAHLQRCAAQRGRWFPLRCAAEALDAIVAPRFVTSLVAVFAVFGVISLAL